MNKLKVFVYVKDCVGELLWNIIILIFLYFVKFYKEIVDDIVVID